MYYKHNDTELNGGLKNVSFPHSNSDAVNSDGFAIRFRTDRFCATKKTRHSDRAVSA